MITTSTEQVWHDFLRRWPQAEIVWQAMADHAQQTEVLSHFASVPELAQRLATSGQSRLFCFLMSALRRLGADLWCLEERLIHVGRSEHPLIWTAEVFLKLKVVGAQLQIRLHKPRKPADWQVLTSDAVVWALDSVVDARLTPLRNRQPYWPDQYEPLETSLPIPLKSKALQQGYLNVPKHYQKIFPAEFLGDAQQPARQSFSLQLPNGQSVQASIRTDLEQIDQQFADLFADEQLIENNRAVITKVASGSYRLEFVRGDATPLTVFAGRAPTKLPQHSIKATPLNQILYGPPGTGKTYETVRAALLILDPLAVVEFDEAVDMATSHSERLAAREVLKASFDQMRAANFVQFVTFHQSFSYEDFVEGLRAVSDEVTGQIRYEVVDGVFKKLCSVDRSFQTPRTCAFHPGQVFGRDYQVVKASEDVLELKKPNGNLLGFSMSMLNTLADAVAAGKITIEDIRQKTAIEKLPDDQLEPFLVNGYNNILPPLVAHMLQAATLTLGSDNTAAQSAEVLSSDVVSKEEARMGITAQTRSFLHKTISHWQAIGVAPVKVYTQPRGDEIAIYVVGDGLCKDDMNRPGFRGGSLT